MSKLGFEATLLTLSANTVVVFGQELDGDLTCMSSPGICAWLKVIRIAK
jgi:hypothetical protein